MASGYPKGAVEEAIEALELAYSYLRTLSEHVDVGQVDRLSTREFTARLELRYEEAKALVGHDVVLRLPSGATLPAHVIEARPGVVRFRRAKPRPGEARVIHG